MPFYEYRQNNSGGSFEIDHERGISVTVTVEAPTASRANKIAEDIGLYFGGEGDCPCCGDRWYSATGYWEEGLDAPNVKHAHRDIHWVEREAGEAAAAAHYVHYADGTVTGYGWAEVEQVED